MLALTVVICATGSAFVDVVLRFAGVLSATAADAIRDGVVGSSAFTSAFLCASCCVCIGRMRSFKAVVARPASSLANGLPGFLLPTMAFFGGTLFAAVLFWGYAPGTADDICTTIAWAATAGCFVVVFSMGMLALFSREEDEVKTAFCMHDRIRAMLDRFEDDTARVRFKVFCARIVAAWAAGAFLWALASVVSALPATVSDLVRWVLTMALLVDTFALVAMLGHVRPGSSDSYLSQFAVQENCNESNDANAGSRHVSLDGIAGSRAYAAANRRRAGTMASPVPFAQATALTASGGTDARDEPGMSSALRCAASQKGLTDREMEAVAWVLANLTSSEAADCMGLKASTVRVYVQRAYRKLGVADYDEARRLYTMREDDATMCANGPDRSASICSSLTERTASLARFWASVAIASGIVVIALLFVPTVGAGGSSWLGESAYVGCAAALFLSVGVGLLVQVDAEEVKDTGRTANAKDVGFAPDSYRDGRIDWDGVIPDEFLFARVVRRSRPAACGFGALTALLGCTLAILPWFARSTFGIWPAIILVVTFAYVLCMVSWGSVLMSRFGLLTEGGLGCRGDRLTIFVGCCVAVVTALLLQRELPWMGLAMAAVTAALFAGSSVAAVSFRTGSDALLDCPEFSVAGREVSGLSRFPGEATLVVQWFAVFCTAMGFIWSRLWEGFAMSFPGLAETLFMIAAIVILCVFFAAQTSGRTRMAVVAFVVSCGVLYAMGVFAAIVYASAFLPALFMLWCCDRGLLRSSSVLWFALMFAVGAFAGLAYSAGVERNMVMWLELSSVGFAWIPSFLQLALSAVTLLALVGLGLSCKFATDERRVRMTMRELEMGTCEGKVRSYLVGRGLNPLQVDVIADIVRGMTSAQIADALSYSIGSINTARLVAYRLLDVHDRVQLMELLARETGHANKN